jgi:hypothetical protein
MEIIEKTIPNKPPMTPAANATTIDRQFYA